MTVTEAADDILTDQFAKSSSHFRVNPEDILIE